VARYRLKEGLPSKRNDSVVFLSELLLLHDFRKVRRYRARTRSCSLAQDIISQIGSSMNFQRHRVGDRTLVELSFETFTREMPSEIK